MAVAINLRQLGIAIQKESRRKERKGDPVNKQLAFTLAYRVAELYWNEESNYSFEEALRAALNEFRIRKEWERDSYSWILGSYFGIHGGRKKAHNRASGKSAKKKTKSDKPLETYEEQDGSHQYSWKV